MIKMFNNFQVFCEKQIQKYLDNEDKILSILFISLNCFYLIAFMYWLYYIVSN